jgi:hypothetical protein
MVGQLQFTEGPVAGYQTTFRLLHRLADGRHTGVLMNTHSSDDALQQRLRLLKEQNDHLQYQNALLHEAIDTICAAFLNDSRNLDTAIQAAMNLTQRARQSPDQIQRPDRNRDMELD